MAVKKCTIGVGCGGTCISSKLDCQSELSVSTSTIADAISKSVDNTSGNYGSVKITPQGTLLKTGHSDEKGIGPLEAEVGRLMAAQGYAPRVLRAEGRELEQELLKAPWKAMQRDYEWVEGDHVLTGAQTQKLNDALSYLHKQGYSHGDLHGKNIFVNPKTDDLRLIDFGLSSRTASDPRAVYRDIRNASSRAPLLLESSSALGRAATLLQTAKDTLKGKKKREAEDAAIAQYLQ